jgi:hypothetical protein
VIGFGLVRGFTRGVAGGAGLPHVRHLWQRDGAVEVHAVVVVVVVIVVVVSSATTIKQRRRSSSKQTSCTCEEQQTKAETRCVPAASTRDDDLSL